MIEEWEDRMWENPKMFDDPFDKIEKSDAYISYSSGVHEELLNLVGGLKFSKAYYNKAINFAINMYRIGFEKYGESFNTELIRLQLLEYKRSLNQHRTVVDQRRGI